ncbi:unnamed protein product [Durusdinium trenchii]|uniref:PH domain-containing protein n=1 Tax=Durusdinium trenchii TaxID=1381693 RepID=A0ABP0KIP8_9DINO
MAVAELRFVLPSHADFSPDEGLFPRVRSLDRAIDRRDTGSRLAGFFSRVRVQASWPQGPGGSAARAVRYRCWIPFCPVEAVVLLESVHLEGDCLEDNALQLPPSLLRLRSVERVELQASVACERDERSLSSTWYCALTVRVESSGPLGLLLRPFLPLLSSRISSNVLEVSRKLLKRHGQAQHKESPMIRTPGEASGCDAGGRTVSRTGGGAGGLFWDCAGGSGGLTINTDLEDEGPGTPATPSIDPEVLLQPSLSKGMPFHNGFLYKLGDGILNNTWNLRYFLLIGQTLQYYRSQHEARPRDAIHLSGVTVEWLKDQSRPFTFAVSKSGSRSYCLSGCSEQEASEWMERIQAASKLGSPPRVEIPTPSSARRCQILASELPLAVPAAQTWQEAKMKHCSQVLVQLLEHRGALRELRQGLRILEAPDSEELLRRTWKDLFFLLLLAMLGLGSLWAAWYVSAALLLAGAASLCFIARGVPVVAAAACVNVPVEEVKEALMEHWRFRDWQPDHLESLPLSLQPGRDEVLRLRCRTGIPGCHFSCELRRRWARSDGARLLLCVEESEGEITSFEGFAIQPLDDGCLVVWLCGLDLAPTPWTPRAVREALAVRRVSALAGLREWLRCRRNGPKTSVSRMEQKLAGGFGRSGAMLKDSLQLQVLPLLLRPFCRARKGGALEAPRDLDRAALSCDVLLELGRQALRGRGREARAGRRAAWVKTS